MTAELIAPSDPEADAFFADARAALTEPEPEPLPEFSPPNDWPMTPPHAGPTLSVGQLHAQQGHALRISYDWMNGRQAMWVGQEFDSGWSIIQGQIGGPASLLTSRYNWAETVRALNEYITPGRAFGGDNLTVDECLPKFSIVCLAHGDGCGEHDGGHNFVRRRTLARYPEGTYRPCGGSRGGVLGGGGHDGIYRYRFQVEGRWRLRFGCRSHHRGLLGQHLDEADGTVTVQLMDDHLPR